MSSWLPQNVQKRLLLYVLQQVSLFSNIDLNNLDVSLGSQSQFSFNDIDLNLQEIKLPNVDILSGKIEKLRLQLAVAGKVNISGEGLIFVMKPIDRFFEDAMSEQWATSLTKSVFDLTTSIMDSDSTVNIKLPADMPQELPKSSTALDSMRNKALQMALSKLTITIKRVEFQFLISPEVLLKVTINSITLLSVDSKRTLDIDGVEVAFSKARPTSDFREGYDSDAEDNENTDSDDILTSSITYSKLEATSLYLSAMESIVLESSDDDIHQLLTIDNINVQFQGITSIDDLKVRDVIIRVQEADFYLAKIVPIRQQLISILRNSYPKSSSHGTGTENMRSYKRFQQEQNIKEEDAITAILLKRVNLHLLDTLEMKFFDISLKQSEGLTTSISIHDLKVIHKSIDRFMSSTSTQPLFSMQTDQTTSEKKMFINRDIFLNFDSSLLTEVLKLANDYSNTYSHLQKFKHADTNQKIDLINFKSQNINIKLIMDDLSFEFAFCPTKSALPHIIFEASKASLFLLSGERRSLIGSFSNLSINSKLNGCFYIPSFNNKFDSIDINTRTMAVLETVNLFISQAELELIIANLTKFFHSTALFAKVTTENNSVGENTKKHVRMMYSSSVIQKRITPSAFSFQVNQANLIIRNILDNTFGDISIDATSIILSQDKNETLSGIIKQLKIKRIYMTETTDILFGVNHDTSKPQVILNIPKLGKWKFYLKGLGMFFDSKWRDLIPPSEDKKSRQKKEALFSPMEIRIYDCSLSLKPYRINTGMVLCFPTSVINISPSESTVSVRSLEILLIDDLKIIRETNSKSLGEVSLSTWFGKQGYSSLTKVDVLSLRMNAANPVSVVMQIQKIDVSVCSDSMNALIQTALDLKPAETYPDSMKYQTEPKSMNIFSDLVEKFFTTNNDTAGETQDNSEAPAISNASVDFEEEHFSTEYSNNSARKPEFSTFSIATSLSIHIKEIKIKLYDGFEWRHTRKKIKSAVERIQESFNDGIGPHETKVFESIYIPAPRDEVENIKDNINIKIHNEETNEGKMKLKPTKKFKILIKGNDLNIEFRGGDDQTSSCKPPSTSVNDYTVLSNTSITVGDLEVMDNLPTSTWNKFLTRSKSNVDQITKGSPMLVFECSLVRPVPHLYATELICNLNVVPLSLHIDQDALEFLTIFFQFKDGRFELLDEYPDISYIQKFEVNSVKLALDYKPKKIDYAGLKSGKTKEFMNFFILDEAKITLKHVVVYGVDGFSQLETILSDIWTPDITKTQIPGILGALTPFKPLAGLTNGARALVSVPTEHYQQNGRLGNSLQKGGMVFLRTTGGEVVKLAVKLTSGTQTILENTEKLLGGQGDAGRNVPITLVEGDEKVDAFIDESLLRSTALFDSKNANKNAHMNVLLDNGDQKTVLSLYADQPKDFNSGLQDAYLSMERNLFLTFDGMKKAKKDIRAAKGAQEAVSTAAKAAPFALIRPLIGVTEALSKTLQGLNNQYDENKIAHIEEKYKSKKHNSYK
ncbi:unnamed protein product [Kluyveromyces dobzhanskii CBS 2104]|uniref:Autophagy-related protein 2 n=1 Tax=Kluyveromyces dobzhanskii CBS 2104 TaxID=1427455 RepID=A0A0A8L7K5_9SACH|nr:unnamed protein product [Kluyveromyces dobzhanskii CBS 2104]